MVNDGNFVSGRQIKSIFALVRNIWLFRKQGHSYSKGGCVCGVSAFKFIFLVLSTSTIILYFWANEFTFSIISCSLDMRLLSNMEFLEMRRSVARLCIDFTKFCLRAVGFALLFAVFWIEWTKLIVNLAINFENIKATFIRSYGVFGSK